MPDDELRTLERALESGGPAARLRLSRALVRSGRCDDAFGVLLDGRDDALVRRELASFGAARDSAAEAGRSRYFDVAPIARTPRVRFRTGEHEGPTLWLYASPFGLVVGSSSGRRARILDIDSGELRHEIPGSGLGAISGEDFVTTAGTAARGRATLDRYDLWTGQLRDRADLESQRNHFAFAATSSRIVVTKLRGPSGGVITFAIDGTTLTRLWALRRRRLFRGKRPSALGRSVLTEQFVLLGEEFAGGTFVALDAATGEECFRTPPLEWDPVGDSAGFVGKTRTGRLIAIDPSGVARTLARRRWLPWALAPDFVVVSGCGRSRGTYVVLDREGAKLSEFRFDGWIGTLARDTVYMYGGQTIRAKTSRGEKLWEFDVGEEIEDITASMRRIYGTTRSRRVFCLDESD